MLYLFGHNARHDQKKAEQFNSAFRSYKKARKNNKPASAFEKFISGLFHFDETAIYSRKLRKYQQQLSRHQVKLEFEKEHPYYDFEIGGEFFKIVNPNISSLERQINILNRLISLLQAFLLNPSTTLEKSIEYSEKLLNTPDSWGGVLSLREVGELNQLEQTAFKIQSDPLYHFILKIRKLVNSLVPRLYRDLRYLFRSIIRFLFKNLDDVSGDDKISIRTFNEIYSSQINMLWHIRRPSIRSTHYLSLMRT